MVVRERLLPVLDRHVELGPYLASQHAPAEQVCSVEVLSQRSSAESSQKRVPDGPVPVTVLILICVQQWHQLQRPPPDLASLIVERGQRFLLI